MLAQSDCKICGHFRSLNMFLRQFFDFHWVLEPIFLQPVHISDKMCQSTFARMEKEFIFSIKDPIDNSQ